jgi:hypothetical protein
MNNRLSVVETYYPVLGYNQSIPKGSTLKISIPIYFDEQKPFDFDAFKKSFKTLDDNEDEIRLEKEDNAVQVIITIKEDLNFGDLYNISFTYSLPNYFFKSGEVYDIYLPFFPNITKPSFQTNYTYSVSIVKELGEINFTSKPFVVDDSYYPNSLFLKPNFEINSPQIVHIRLGKKQFYKFSIKQPYTKTSSNPYRFNTYSIVIPRNITSGNISQTVYFNKLDLSINKAYLDSNDNLIAEFKVPSNRNGTIEIEGFVSIEKNKNIDSDWGTIEDIPQNILMNATQSAKYWESDHPEIVETSKNITTTTNIYETTKSIYNYVIEKIDYSLVKKYGINQRQGALATLRGSSAVCMEYSDLFITLMRAQNIPARGAFGYGFDPLSPEYTILHQWAEVYAPKKNTWIPIDTTWGENGNWEEYKNNLIGGDLNHVYFYVATDSPEEPAPVWVNFVGNLNEIPKAQYEILPVSTQSKKNTLTQDDVLKQYSQEKTQSYYFKESITNIGNDILQLLDIKNKSSDINFFAGISAHIILIICLIICLYAILKLLTSSISQISKSFKKRYTISNG